MSTKNQTPYQPNATLTTFDVKVVGAPPERLGDLYHTFLRASWARALGWIVIAFLAINVVFACAYYFVGGLANTHGTFASAFFFSVQTMGTIGYGDIHPEPDSVGANLVVTAEAVVSLLVTALATGLVFAKFSISTARIVFTREATIAPMDGAPTLAFRVGNARSNQIVEAQLRVTLMRTERTQEGHIFYRMRDLKLSRERSQAFSRSWTALHVIDKDSPLFGLTPQHLDKDEVEIIVSVAGMDDISMQPVHARHTYEAKSIIFGARHADILTEGADGQITLDLRKFHDLEPTKPTETFPYPVHVPDSNHGDAETQGQN